MIKRWPKRREFLAYYLLLKYAKAKKARQNGDDGCINAGEAIDVLRVFTGSKKLAISLLRQLVKRGFLARKASLIYCPRDIAELLDEALVYYLAGRLRRRGVKAVVEGTSNVLLLDKNSCDDGVAEILAKIGLRVQCVDIQ